MAEEAVMAMQQQFTTALDGSTWQNVDLRAELAQSRHQAASELAALRQEIRAPQRGSPTTGVGVHTRLPGKPGEFLGTQDAWRDWSAVFWGYAGAAVQKPMVEAAKAGTPDPKRHDLGGRRSGSIGTASLDLQGSSSETSCSWQVTVKVSKRGDN